MSVRVGQPFRDPYPARRLDTGQLIEMMSWDRTVFWAGAATDPAAQTARYLSMALGHAQAIESELADRDATIDELRGIIAGHVASLADRDVDLHVARQKIAEIVRANGEVATLLVEERDARLVVPTRVDASLWEDEDGPKSRALVDRAFDETRNP